ncbi:serine/threonine-protein kinase [Tsukamurella spumae]|uniref:non-specific serine/threonine protein kinase n=1 Tax=Tsukamurella spumae TaxID=44753 RepID=A0A846WYB9_9ACTN|nr:serine/threonine-protein kinase [Tsukamurella spumae]NKY16790.1 serine/threonine protein kinase [Tsukamurella spumae]
MGDVVAGYAVLRRLGRGGSADVFLAQRPGEEPVALKLLRTADTSGHAYRRFQREFRLTDKVAGPNVAAVLDCGEDPVVPLGGTPGDPRAWIALQYVDGAAATTFVPGEVEPDLAVIVPVLVDVGHALDDCHRAGVLHRDVKPANILVEGAGLGARGVLSDFGIAQPLVPPATVLYDGDLLFSLPYAAPELLRAQDLFPQTDGYAFAATAFELLTGRPPFLRRTELAVRHAHLHASAPAPDSVRRWLPASLTAVFRKALAKRVDDRYPTCTRLAEILHRTLRDVKPRPST